MDEELDKIIEYENIVYGIINRYNGYQDRDDLYQVGMIGLMKASKNYIPNDNCKFSTYAYKYVLGEITKYMRENNSLKVSRDTVKLKQSLSRAKDSLRQKLLREPTTLELSLVLEIDEAKIIEIDSLQTETKSLDYEFLENENNLYNSVRIEEKQFKPEIQDLKAQLELLDDLDKKLIYSRYFVNLTQSETSQKLGMSQAKVSRKETKILQKLKENL